MSSAGSGGGRGLHQTLDVDWEEPPSTVLDVDVKIVYRDGTRDRVDDEYLSIAPEGVVVEGYPVEPGKRILQAEVDYNETTGPFEKLWSFLTNLDEEIEKTREEFSNRRRRR